MDDPDGTSPLLVWGTVGIALLIGPAAAFDLRLLGLGQQKLRVTTLGGYLLPLSRLGFVIAAVTGVLMFLPGASVVAERGSAPWKLGLLLIAGLNVLIFHRRTYRSVADWDLGERTPVPARTAAVVSLASWAGGHDGGQSPGLHLTDSDVAPSVGSARCCHAEK